MVNRLQKPSKMRHRGEDRVGSPASSLIRRPRQRTEMITLALQVEAIPKTNSNLNYLLSSNNNSQGTKCKIKILDLNSSNIHQVALPKIKIIAKAILNCKTNNKWCKISNNTNKLSIKLSSSEMQFKMDRLHQLKCKKLCFSLVLDKCRIRLEGFQECQEDHRLVGLLEVVSCIQMASKEPMEELDRAVNRMVVGLNRLEVSFLE